MTNNTNKILIYGGGAILIALATIFFVVKSSKKTIGKTAFRKRSVKIAQDEYEKWGKGSKKDSDNSMYANLKRYWNSLGWNESQWSPTGTAWSSSFISYVMKTAKADEEDFKFASQHSTYIYEAIQNKKNNTKKGFKGYRLNEKKVEVGDLVCYARQGGIDYDTNSSQYSAHCDLVIGVDSDDAYAIGGNVSDSVSMSKIPLDDKGYVEEGNKRFVVIKTK